MKIIRALFLFCFVFVSTSRAEESLVRREWNVNGVTREALIYIPVTAKTKPAPVVFAFHGHGGSMQRAAKMFHCETLWPEAIVVYMQGLNTPGRLTDPEGKKPGWQQGVGAENDRDLKFFDTVLASLKKDYKVDEKRIYSTGHSNGGSFTYLLWEARGKVFAAFAPSAALSRSLVEPKDSGTGAKEKDSNFHAADSAFLPKPVLHVAGENDPLVKFAWQKMMMDALRKKNQCAEGKPWQNEKGCTIYESKLGAPVVTFIHPGTHQFPDRAPAIIVKFFKQHALN
jgi:polyhydroxybutyrate depolymerase